MGPLGPEGPIGLNPKLARYAYINFTIPEARKWLIDKISSVMIENNVTGYREDTGLPSGEADTPGPDRCRRNEADAVLL